ncbi:MAG: acetylornithine deacetylase, partial [Gammaproteobacteria bacterium]|nr:acetylornithine deacetylase [Gammaproteobacteria bacterium]
ELVYDAEGKKANLYATLGPVDKPGLVLSGHTDVVPVDGQDWNTDPYQLTEKNGRLFGRGSSDMKSFIGVCLYLVPKILQTPLETPIHLAFSYDEEIGCVGVRTLLSELARRDVKPKACLIGEPTEMGIIRAHKGKLSKRCTVHGLECHSGMTNQGVNAVEAAAETIAHLKKMARRFRDQGPFDPELNPPYTTVHTGVVNGGTALNIIPKECSFEFEFRHLPDDDPQVLLKEIQTYTEQELLPEMREVFPQAGFEWQTLSQFPGLSTEQDAAITELVKTVAGTDKTGKVSFGTEGGLFQQIGIPSIVCGPGSINVAHKPNEYIEPDQITQCELFIERLVNQASNSL